MLNYPGPGLGSSLGIPPGVVFQDINSCGRNPQAYVNSVIAQGSPIAPMPAPPILRPPMMIPPDHYMHPPEEENHPIWQNPVFRWAIYGLALFGVWRLGADRLVKEIAIRFNERNALGHHIVK